MESLIGVFTSPGSELLEIGPFSFRWYGLLIALSVFIGLNLSSRLALKRGLPKELVSELLPILVFSSIIGARIYYVTFEWESYRNNWLEIIAIWKGGIAIHGAMIGGSLAIFLFCRFKKQNFWEFLDVIIPSVVLGQAIGRWGNFFNNEAFGLPTNLPWKLFIPLNSRPLIFVNEQFFHPTFLYESIWNIVIFIILFSLFRLSHRKSITPKIGSISCIYLLTYSVGRIFIEGLRIDPLCIASTPPFCEGGIRIAQLMSIFLASLGTLGLWRLYIQKKSLPTTHSMLTK